LNPLSLRRFPRDTLWHPAPGTSGRYRQWLKDPGSPTRCSELFLQVSRTVKPQGSLWARRSLFMVGKSPILVTEVFLPGVLAL